MQQSSPSRSPSGLLRHQPPSRSVLPLRGQVGTTGTNRLPEGPLGSSPPQFFLTFPPGGLLAGPSRAASHLCGAAPTFQVGTPGFPVSPHVRILVPRTSPAERPASCPRAGPNSSSEVLLFPQPEAPRGGAPLGVWAPITPRVPGMRRAPAACGGMHHGPRTATARWRP